MLAFKKLLFLLLSKNTVYYGITKGMRKITKTRFFISKYHAQTWFEKVVAEWEKYSDDNKTFLSPVMLFSNFYTLSYNTIEYKIVYDPEIELGYLSLWVNKKILFHMLADPEKMQKKIMEMEYNSVANQIEFKPFYESRSESSDSW